MRTKCYVAASAIRFSDSDFLKHSSNNLASRGRFHAMTLIFDPLTLNVCCRSSVTWTNSVPNLIEIRNQTIRIWVIQSINQSINLYFRHMAHKKVEKTDTKYLQWIYVYKTKP